MLNATSAGNKALPQKHVLCVVTQFVSCVLLLERSSGVQFVEATS
jgi:hypothetical protein